MPLRSNVPADDPARIRRLKRAGLKTRDAMRWAILRALQRLGERPQYSVLVDVVGYGYCIGDMIAIMKGEGLVAGQQGVYILTERGKIALAIKDGQEARRLALLTAVNADVRNLKARVAGSSFQVQV